MATPLNLSISSPRYKVSPSPLLPDRKLNFRPIISAMSNSDGDPSSIEFSSRTSRLHSKLDQSEFHSNPSNGVIKACMPAVPTPGGLLDLSTVLFRNRMIFIGDPIFSEVAEEVISQLVTLATIDEESDILIYLNCEGGSVYSVLAIYDCMSWIKPKVGTVCLGIVAAESVLLLAGGHKGMRYSMPNTRIMMDQPRGGIEGHVEGVRRDINEAIHNRHKMDKMFAAFTGQPLEKVQHLTDRHRFLSAAEAMEFGLIDGILETKE